MAREESLQASTPIFPPLSNLWQIALFVVSFLIVSFGQPAWHMIPSLIAATIGYALFFRVVLLYRSRTKRFWLGTVWFMAVQLVQLQWALSHPFNYIYALWAFAAFFFGCQFGLLCLFVTPPQLRKITRIAAIAGLWTLIEWSRLFIFSGYTLNPIGIALSGHIYPLQTASIWGVYGLSFWVMFVNLLAARAWMYRFAWFKSAMFTAMAAIPFIFGAFHLEIHREKMAEYEKKDPYYIVLVQTVFPVEEALATKNMTVYVTDEWRQILNITAKHLGKDIDMIVLPEFVVPFGTWTPVYPYEVVKEVFLNAYGSNAISKLPPLKPPFAKWGQVGSDAPGWYVTNAYWVQGMANVFDSDIVAGLEDVDLNHDGDRVLYSSALHFKPLTTEMAEKSYLDVPINRYEKRILVPMGEYIPFTFLADIAKDYGITGSFTPGEKAKVFPHEKVPFGVCICYEETYGEMMRGNRKRGAKMLMNITSDVWYPNSMLPQQHFDHARLRTVENGIPLVRACNTGITSGIDSLGQTVAILGKNAYDKQSISDSIRFEVPTYTYRTLYSKVGDALIIGFALLATLVGLRFRDGEY